MGCPRCKVDFRAVKVGGVELDLCEKCEGIWFDANELDRVFSVYGTDLGKTDLGESVNAEVVTRQGESEGQNELPCPRCEQMLLRKKYAEDCPVLIDGCTQGCGLWLDAGELGEIIRYIAKQRNLDNPEHETDLLLQAIQIENKARDDEERRIDDMVAADNKGTGLSKLLGCALQGVYRKLYKAGF